ncbi:hypothetical protein KORDIASMS9_04535 [Kordia sp. SMS9]|nr:hypothetical protein KORDIASMS9_04535 [Kordia sp. SMS9]
MTLERINNLFYIGLLVSFLIFLLPSEYKMAVYTPNLLGWSMLVLSLISFSIYFWLLIIDFKKKNYKRLQKRTLFLVIIIGVSVAYWFYQAYSLGNV